MKKTFATHTFLLIGMFYCFLLIGCLKDSCKQTYRMFKPIYKTLTQVRMNMKSSGPEALKNTGKIYTYGKYIFLSEVNQGIHVIDNSNPAAPQNISFIAVPGNGDLAVKGNYLYADSYSDIVVFDISNPTHIEARKFINAVFPDRGGYFWGNTTNPDSVNVVVGYEQKDTTISCDSYNARYLLSSCANCSFYSLASPQASTGPIGIGGSLSRFAIINNYLYGVSTADLYAFNLSNPADPSFASKETVGNWSIETIYPFKDKLFIGSTNGMFIYDVANPGTPAQVGQFSHVRSCDPVITDGNFAYVTLRSGTQCAGFTNQLDILNVSNLTQPSLVKSYPLTNPHGLAKDGNLLFICDGKGGLKMFAANSDGTVELYKTISDMETLDVIANNGIALVVATDGLYQFEYTDKNNIRQISKIGLQKN